MENFFTGLSILLEELERLLELLGRIFEELRMILEQFAYLLEQMVFRQYFGQTLRDFFCYRPSVALLFIPPCPNLGMEG